MKHPAGSGTIGLMTAMLIAVANMIGTGVFTSLGYQVVSIHTTFALLMLWVIGGVVALAGAFCYAELGAALPRSGGEYHFLSAIYHPSAGFVAGWVSLVAGFAAPTALAAMAFAKYAAPAADRVDTVHLGAGAVIAIAAIHGYSGKGGHLFQNFFTGVKILVIVFFIVAGLLSPDHRELDLLPGPGALAEMATPPYFIALVYVSFAYTGWNAAAYFVREIRSPGKNLPPALIYATALVMVLYGLLNYVFLYLVPAGELAGKIEIGYIAALRLFGEEGGRLLSLVIAMLMLSTIGAMIFIGARVVQAMGTDYPVLAVLEKASSSGTPFRAVLFQTAVTLLFIYTSTFEQVIIYTTFTLLLINSLTVAGVVVLRWRKPGLPRPYRAWGYPVTPFGFLAVNLAIMGYVCYEKPAESVIGLGIVLTGFVLYLLNRRLRRDGAASR